MNDDALRPSLLQMPKEVQAHYDRSKDSLIMMIDDEPILMGVIQTFLKDWGYKRFVTCDDSTKAIEMIKASQPDVLLLDLIMPSVSGFDILIELSNDDNMSHLPVIVLTSSSDSETKLKALELGATDFLAKPVDSSELALRLRNTLTVKAHQDRLANSDQLTGLPNRKTFLERLDWAMRRKKLEAENRSIMILGLDRFKSINDSLSLAVGDEILIQVAGRIQDVLRDEGIESPTVARLGGDEFALLFGPADATLASDLALALLTEIRAPFYVDGSEVFVTSTIGITSTLDVTQPDEILQKASVAEKFAKQKGGDSFQIYSAEIDAEAEALYRLGVDLRRALENDELELFYQAKVDAKTHQPIGMESLLRWRTANGEFVAPDRFIPVAESSGLIVPIGEWILNQACEQNKELQALGFDLKVAVNVSGHQISDSNFFKVVSDALQKSDLPPNNLLIEITETVLMSDLNKSMHVLNQVKDLGINLSVDDFGTGYSSLSYLKQLPISELKIDQSFIKDLKEGTHDATIVKAILAMAHALELTVTAEGVENTTQAKFLEGIDCELLQGYFFSKPLSFKEFKDYCSTHKGN